MKSHVSKRAGAFSISRFVGIRLGARVSAEGRCCCGARTPGALPENHHGASRSAVRRGLRRSRTLLARGVATEFGCGCADGDSGAIYGGGECVCVEECGRKPRRDWTEHRRLLLRLRWRWEARSVPSERRGGRHKPTAAQPRRWTI